MLAFFDLVIGELHNLAAIRADKMVVVIAIVKLEYRLATVELAAYQNTGLLKLGQHTIHGRQADIDIFGDKGPVDVFGALVANIRTAENIKNLQARESCLQAHALEFVLVIHS